jgi:hypothetical protein
MKPIRGVTAGIGVLIAVAYGGLCWSLGLTVAGRLLRNPFLPKSPVPLAPFYETCSDALLTRKVTLVITVKDTCTQAALLLSHLASMVPRDIPVVYVYPNFVGCDAVDPQTNLFDDFTVVQIPSSASPIQGFLDAQAHIKTPFAMLMHNDAYMMEGQAVCELMQALEAHPEAAFSAPQLYERSDNGISVPHGHHKNLHVRASGTGGERLAVNYDIDFDLLTQRRAKDFQSQGYAQMDFMEDHAYMGRTETYHLYLDSEASFTMEYIDNILAMRANDTWPWYVPTARFVFDVDVHKVGWRDIPYFVHKRSEEIGLTVRKYLTRKWGVEFPNTGIWNYVRHNYLHDAVLDDNLLPQEWSSQAALYYSWFQSIGFNRYNGKTLHDLLHSPLGERPSDGDMRISRTMNYAVEHVRPPPHGRGAKDILPYVERRKVINITLVDETIPIALSVSSECRPAACGMLVLDQGKCMCFTYIERYERQRGFGLFWLLDVLKLPSRVLKFVQMKYTTASDSTRLNGATLRCEANDVDCVMVTPAFSKTARLVQWSWFGGTTFLE